MGSENRSENIWPDSVRELSQGQSAGNRSGEDLFPFPSSGRRRRREKKEYKGVSRFTHAINNSCHNMNCTLIKDWAPLPYPFNCLVCYREEAEKFKTEAEKRDERIKAAKEKEKDKKERKKKNKAFWSSIFGDDFFGDKDREDEDSETEEEK